MVRHDAACAVVKLCTVTCVFVNVRGMMRVVKGGKDDDTECGVCECGVERRGVF